ncbi:MAG: hypothetical protein GY828_04395 [Candidatus Gracilibacteria bacterium]|nr:hypothetical protein [Candidatus Gracilibacteria bacterium]
MIQQTKKAGVLIYTLVLVLLSLSMATIITSNISTLEDTLVISQNYADFNLTGGKETKSIFQRSNYFNSNGSGITDNLSCPTNITMSGTTLRTTGINTVLTYTGGVNGCGIEYDGDYLEISFNTDFSDFDQASWRLGDPSFNDVSGTMVGLKDFGADAGIDPDYTFITFPRSAYLQPDNIDDNFNSDDYTVDSSSGNVYATGYIDDDADARIYKVGFIEPNDTWENVFWNNSKIESYIASNTNNDSPSAHKLGTGSGHLYLDIEGDYDLRIVGFAKNKFSTSGELVPNGFRYEVGMGTGSGYLQNDATLESFTDTSSRTFHFNATDYAFFIKNTGSSLLKYKVGFANADGKKIISLPLKDDEVGRLSYLYNKIIINGDGRYRYQQVEMFGEK